MYCTAGASDRRFNPANTVHCLDGYFADVTGADTDICQQETVCGAATVSTAGIDNYQLTPPTKDTDRVCAAWAVCVAMINTKRLHQIVSQIESVPQDFNVPPHNTKTMPIHWHSIENRECAPLTVCGAADVSTAGVGNHETDRTHRHKR